MIRQKELFEYWDNNHNFINTCTLKEGNNIINLIKNLNVGKAFIILFF